MDKFKPGSESSEADSEFEGRLHIGFALTGKDLIPNDVTTRLGIESPRSFRRGDVKINSDGEKLIRKSSFWGIDSDNEGLPQDDIMPHLEWLLGLLEPVRDELKEILKNRNIRARISCFWITPDGRINVEVEPELLVRLANFNVKIWFDIYCHHDI